MWSMMARAARLLVSLAEIASVSLVPAAAEGDAQQDPRHRLDRPIPLGHEIEQITLRFGPAEAVGARIQADAAERQTWPRVDLRLRRIRRKVERGLRDGRRDRQHRRDRKRQGLNSVIGHAGCSRRLRRRDSIWYPRVLSATRALLLEEAANGRV